MLRESLGPGPAGPGAVAEARPQLISVDCTTGQTLFVPGLCRLVVNTASPEKMCETEVQLKSWSRGMAGHLG